MRLTGPRVLLPAAVAIAAVGAAVYLVRRENTDLREAREALDRRDFAAAGARLDAYLAAHPDDADARFLAARTARRRGDVGAAREHLRRCRGAKPPRREVELEYKLLRVQEGETDEVAELMAVRPDDPDAPYIFEAVASGALRSAASRLGPTAGPPPAAALAHATRATELWLESRPGRADQAAGLLWRARIRGLSGDLDSVAADLRRALELDPDGYDARFELAAVVGRRDLAEAARHLELLRDRDPTRNRVRHALATAYRGLGRLDDAERVLDGMLATNADDASALHLAGLVAIDRGRPADAERHLRRAYDLAPNSPEVNLALAECLRLLGRPDEAREFRDRSERLGRGRPG